MSLTPILDRLFPPRGPCAFCGDEIVGARHRVIDAIAERVHAGDPIEEVASEYPGDWEAALVACAFVEGWEAGRKRKRRAKEATQ